MRFGLYLPIFNDFHEPGVLVDLAVRAEAAGFDGFFIWDHLAIVPDGSLALTDATVALGAIAQATSKILFGPMITPLARRRPGKVAREIAALDQLSDGRLIFGVGVGEPGQIDFAKFGDAGSARERGARVDEALSVIDPLLRGETVDHAGEYYQVNGITFAPRCVTQPRTPIWVAASLPTTKGVRRAAQWDGCFPIKIPAAVAEGAVSTASWPEWWLEPDEFSEVVELIRQFRGDLDAFDIAATGTTLDGGAVSTANKVASYETAGATWWMEWIDDAPGALEQVNTLIDRGPPRPD